MNYKLYYILLNLNYIISFFLRKISPATVCDKKLYQPVRG